MALLFLAGGARRPNPVLEVGRRLEQRLALLFLAGGAQHTPRQTHGATDFRSLEQRWRRGRKEGGTTLKSSNPNTKGGEKVKSKVKR